MLEIEFERFNAEAGCGIAEFSPRPPSVYRRESDSINPRKAVMSAYFSRFAHTK